MEPDRFVPYALPSYSDAERRERGEAFLRTMDARRSVRDFADTPVPRELIELAIQAASTAPSGAHRQPWTFVAVSDPAIKRAIREAAEQEEFQFYEGGRAPDAWINALRPLGTTWQKPFLETAPWLVVVFEQLHLEGEDGSKQPNYYTKESVGIACGMFITALHTMGLATLTHTPSPMKFLSRILGRPSRERSYILFPVGLPAEGVQVPDLRRKSLDEMSIWNPQPEAPAE